MARYLVSFRTRHPEQCEALDREQLAGSISCPKCSDKRRDWLDWMMPDGTASGEYSFRCVGCGHDWARGSNGEDDC